MIYGVFAVRDKLLGFGSPTIDQSDAVATRNFKLGLSASGSRVVPADLDLYAIGQFDSESGVIAPLPAPKFLVNGGDLTE